MKIYYYMPFKPMDHHTPSGDLMLGRGIFEHLQQHHEIEVASKLRLRHLPQRPNLWFKLVCELCRLWGRKRVELWLTYHSYYKAPDLLGALYCKITGTPYVIFQGIYSSKRRREAKNRLGFYLNRYALQRAQLVITNKKNDLINLKRLLPEERIHYLAPGIDPELFVRQEDGRKKVRKKWAADEQTVIILATAMFRPGVKTQSLQYLIDAFAQVLRQRPTARLIIAGDGENSVEIHSYAKKLGQSVHFPGKIQREELSSYYSAADIFAFPGIGESLGMVYLEAQSCALPVVACREWGASEAVVDGHTGLLCPHENANAFCASIIQLIDNPALRLELGNNAKKYIRKHHNRKKNYQALSHILNQTLICQGS